MNWASKDDRIVWLVDHVDGCACRANASNSRPIGKRDHLDVEAGQIETFDQALDVDLRPAAGATGHQLGDDDALHSVDADHAAVPSRGGLSTSTR